MHKNYKVCFIDKGKSCEMIIFTDDIIKQCNIYKLKWFMIVDLENIELLK